MTLESLGYDATFESFRQEQHLAALGVGRIIAEHKERYRIKSETGEFDGELLGNLRYQAESRLDFPAVGDWVAFAEYDEDKAIIHAIFPRKSIIERQAVGKFGQKQIIATNIDYGLIVQAVDRDFNINRLERYLTICNASKVKPIIVVSKTDLVSESTLKTMLDHIAERIEDVSIVAVSTQAEIGYKALIPLIEPGKTYCLLGSSGVGKSTLINNLAGREVMETGAISASINKGKHITSHRELILLENGGILIDNPGMREVGIADTTHGLETTFDHIASLAERCQFNDCTHIHEKGCAVLAAVENGEIDQGAYENYLKMVREKAHFESSIEQRRKKDKAFGKMIKKHKAFRKKDKY